MKVIIAKVVTDLNKESDLNPDRLDVCVLFRL